MNRRRFLTSTTALLCAPAIVRAENLMKIWVPPRKSLEFPIPCRWISLEEAAKAFPPSTYADIETAHRLIRETSAIYEAFDIKMKRLRGSDA